MANILVVEDDNNLRETLVDILELEGYYVTSADSVETAKHSLIQSMPENGQISQLNILDNTNKSSIDLLILDIMLPDGNGYELCEWLKNQNHPAFVLMLTARNLEQDLVTGFVSGADDYVTKPYKSQELLLRIKALLRRQQSHNFKDSYFQGTGSPKKQTVLNGYTINWEQRQVRYEQQVIHLTKTAFDLLHFLYSRKNTVVSREQILQNVWGQNVFVDNRTVDNFVYQLKKSLDLIEPKPSYIRSIRGVGYSLVFTEV